MFKKILIANRGEIALRILRACKELSISTVAVHSQEDDKAMHVHLADESVCIGAAPSRDSYLNSTAILSAAEITGADAIHPGFGFLSENAAFARMVRDHGLQFIGPSAEHIHLMGQKIGAKQKAVELGLEVIQGSKEELRSLREAKDLASSIGYPILLKASAGGGGKGMRVVRTAETLEEQFYGAQQESFANFGSSAIYMEKFLAHPRHIEFQVLGDHYGNVVCLGDRECSLQRNHQKLWEEAPSAALSKEERATMTKKVLTAMRTLGYYNAGTVEFLYEDGAFYFIEMNTRIQVEHPVTEFITGIDLVKQQILIAAGEALPFSQEDIVLKGHAIECRINAEDPETFFPSPGIVELYLAPGGPFTRVDSALFAGARVSPYYDSLIAKLIVYGEDRQECLQRLRRALDEYVISGIHTLIPLHQHLCTVPAIQDGAFHIKWLQEYLQSRSKEA